MTPAGYRLLKRILGVGAVLLGWMTPPSHSSAAELTSVWDLKREHLRILVAAPQVMVTRTASGWDAYCRCPVVLKPREIPEAMKKAIIAVEDRRYMDHDGVDLIALASVLRGGLNRGGSTIPMQLLKNLVFHDLQRRDILSKLERKGAEIWHASTLMERSGSRNSSPPILTRSSLAAARLSACTEPAGTTSGRSRKT